MIFSLALTGPTASGKTTLSLKVAKELGCEIISLDSMQIYKGMDIGTAKATAEERAVIPHHMIDVAEPTDSYSAENYRTDALRIAREICERGKVPLFVGGTGLYIDTLMRPGGNGAPESSPEFRERILSGVKSDEDALRLWEQLRDVDPDSAEKIHMNNTRRVARALEIYERTGKTKTYFDNLRGSEPKDIRVGMMTLDFHNRALLYDRVDRRVDMMIGEGLIEEVRGLYEGGLLSPSSTASQAIGYKELVTYLKGECTLDEAVESIKLSSRRYAKRQLTWFRHEADAIRIYIDNDDGTPKDADSLISETVECSRELLKKVKP